MKLLCRLLLRMSVLCATMLLFAVVSHAQTAIVLRGTVTDRNTGALLAGVSVDGGCGQTITDGNGSYSFNAQQLCNNATGGVSLQGTGYYRTSAQFTITASPTILDVTLLPGGTLVQGTVTDASTQAGIAGATVRMCTIFCNFILITTTDAGGQYAIDSSQLPNLLPRVLRSFVCWHLQRVISITNSSIAIKPYYSPSALLPRQPITFR